jgi:L-fuculose-phosphate aldolase
MEVKLGGLADTIAQALNHHRIVMVHGHGSFAMGQLLEEAHDSTTMLEESCRVICLLKSLQKVSSPASQ